MRAALAQVQGVLAEFMCAEAGCASWLRCKGQQERLQHGNAAIAGTWAHLLRSARVLPSEVLDRHCFSSSAQLVDSNSRHWCWSMGCRQAQLAQNTLEFETQKLHPQDQLSRAKLPAHET